MTSYKSCKYAVLILFVYLSFFNIDDMVEFPRSMS